MDRYSHTIHTVPLITGGATAPRKPPGKPAHSVPRPPRRGRAPGGAAPAGTTAPLSNARARGAQ